MEANEVPERLYLSQERDGDGCYVDLMWHKHPYENMENVEYIRKDAFIEKACKFLKSYRQDILDGTGYIAGIVNDKTIEDFKNYMKGE